MKNPLRLLGIYRKASEVLDTLDDGRKDWEARKASPTTSLYTSPEWWTRLLAAARELALVVGLPADMEQRLMMKNWKTTLSGAAAILAVIAKVAATGSIDWTTDGPAVLAGLGLIFAKDAKDANTPK
jgi:hypothetical protein